MCCVSLYIGSLNPLQLCIMAITMFISKEDTEFHLSSSPKLAETESKFSSDSKIPHLSPVLDVGLLHLTSPVIYPPFFPEFFILISFLRKGRQLFFSKSLCTISPFPFPPKITFEKSFLTTSNHFLLVFCKNDSGVTPGTLKGWYIIERNCSNGSLMLRCCSQLLLNLQPWGYEWQPIKVLRKLKLGEKRSKSISIYLTKIY